MIDIKVPTVGESISEVTLLKWNKKDGDYVERDEVIAELESEKATFEVNAEQAGVLKTSAQEGDTLKIGDLLASIDEPNTPPFVIVNVPPVSSSVVSLLSLAFVASSITFFSISAILRLSTLRITGTVNPLGVLTAMLISA